MLGQDIPESGRFMRFVHGAHQVQQRANTKSGRDVGSQVLHHFIQDFFTFRLAISAISFINETAAE
jgi:hypothetical protein